MTHRFFTKRWHSVALVALVTMSLVAFGCGTKNDSSSTTNPNPNTLQPTGTIQGVLTDAFTGAPIVGAVIDVGVAQSTTNQNGQFTLWNLPATEDSSDTSSASGSYVGTIDLTTVTSPVNMTTTPKVLPRYPDKRYFSAEVYFGSLNDTTNDFNDGNNEVLVGGQGGNSSNHDTPVVGLVSSVKLSVGKLAAKIDGLVVNSSGTPQGGFKVDLGYAGYADSGPTMSSSGIINGSVIRTTTTNNDPTSAQFGRFAFDNVESATSYGVLAYNSDKSLIGQFANGKPYTFKAPSDGNTFTMVAQATGFSGQLIGPPLVVKSSDTLRPTVKVAFPENNSDIQAQDDLVVTFTFTEAVKQNAYTLALTAGSAFNGGIYSDISVQYLGAKAGNIAHTIGPWSSDNKSLPVKFNTSASSKYSVTLKKEALPKLTDANGNPVAVLSVPDPDPNYKDRVTSFTTSGGALAQRPTNLVITSNTLDYNDFPVTLDWPPSSGRYRVYRATDQVFGGYLGQTPAPTVVAGTLKEIEPVAPATQFESDFKDPLSVAKRDITNQQYNFVNGQNQIYYRYKVVALNQDGDEGDATDEEIAADTVKPKITLPTSGTISNLYTDYAGDDTITVNFTEPMDEVSAECITAATCAPIYTVKGLNGTTLVTVQTATLQPGYTTVQLKLSASIDNLAVLLPRIISGANGICNSTLSPFDNVNIPINQGKPNSICAFGDNAVLVVGLGGTTVFQASDNTVRSGATGVCTYTAAPAGTLNVSYPINPGNGEANSVCITSFDSGNQEDGIISSIRGGDDVIVNPEVISVTGVRDVSGNPIDPAGNVAGFGLVGPPLLIGP